MEKKRKAKAEIKKTAINGGEREKKIRFGSR